MRTFYIHLEEGRGVVIVRECIYGAPGEEGLPVQVPVVTTQTHLVEARPRSNRRRNDAVYRAIECLDPALGFVWKAFEELLHQITVTHFRRTTAHTENVGFKAPLIVTTYAIYNARFVAPLSRLLRREARMGSGQLVHRAQAVEAPTLLVVPVGENSEIAATKWT
jgi:hypothetical protein